MADTTKERAREVIHNVNPHVGYYRQCRTCEEMIEALAAANLLRTGIEERAVAACRVYAQHNSHDAIENYMQQCQPVLRVGREVLAAETPKPRYRHIAAPYVSPGFQWCVIDGMEPTGGFAVAYFRDEAKARDCAANLNRVGAEGRP